MIVTRLINIIIVLILVKVSLSNRNTTIITYVVQDSSWNNCLYRCLFRLIKSNKISIYSLFCLGFMVLNATSNNISVISWRSVLLLEVSTITVPLVDLVVYVYSVLLETHHLTSDIQRREQIVVLYEIYSKKLQWPNIFCTSLYASCPFLLTPARDPGRGAEEAYNRLHRRTGRLIEDTFGRRKCRWLMLHKFGRFHKIYWIPDNK
jgi:hypothetical protein